MVSLTEYIQSSINEGIDIDTPRNSTNKYVSFNPGHEHLVNMSLDSNPSVDTSTIKDIEIWSIFQRNDISYSDKTKQADGNPLIHAFKNDSIWKFKTKKDKELILNRISQILEKFDKEHKYSGTILVPSTSILNDIFITKYKEINPDIQVIDKLIFKMTTDDVWNTVNKTNSKFKKIFSNNTDNALDKLEDYLDIMDKENNGLFTFHKIDNIKIRNAITQTLKIADDPEGKFASMINDKDILIVDDSISRGNTLKQAIKLIQSKFVPKSITILTLFSKKYKTL